MTRVAALPRLKLDHPLIPALFTTLVLAALAARTLSTHGWDPLALVLLTP